MVLVVQLGLVGLVRNKCLGVIFISSVPRSKINRFRIGSLQFLNTAKWFGVLLFADRIMEV